MSKQNPFPNQGEIIRYLAGAFDLKTSKKKVDEFARAGDIDYRARAQLIDEVFYLPVVKFLDEDIAQLLQSQINDFLDDYLELVKGVALDGVPRDVALPLLVNNLFANAGFNLLQILLQQVDGPSVSDLCSTNHTAIDAVIRWYESNIEQWSAFHMSWSKEHKDRLLVWRKNEELPQINSIKLILGWSEIAGLQISSESSKQIKVLMFIARAVDWIQKSCRGRIEWNVNDKELSTDVNLQYLADLLAHEQMKYNERYESLETIAQCLFDRLSVKKQKTQNAQKEIRSQLDELKQLQASVDAEGLASYYINWLEAKWYLFSGKLKQAVKYYKLAFEQCLYSAGENQKVIFKEACLVAAKSNNRAFLKRLKHQAITFGWLVAPTLAEECNVNNKKSRSNSNIVEDWEIEKWVGRFSRIFPNEYMFDGCLHNVSNDRLAPNASTFDEIEDLKPDLRYPNRMIKTGSWQKQIPQLVWFTMNNKIDYIRQLLDKGASVNVTSEYGETPILLAIQNMDPTLIPLKKPDIRAFNLIATFGHQPEIINMSTSKKKLLPLICAVETGRIEVVRKVIELGAIVDRRGGFEQQTALNFCLGIIGRIVNPAKFQDYIAKQNANPSKALLDSLQRTEGMGMTLQETKQMLKRQENNLEYQQIEKAFMQILTEREGSLNVDALREIAMLLLDAGADPNAEHDASIAGYTPLMLAAEMDEVVLLEKMLEYDGDPLKSYYWIEKKQHVDCLSIAVGFRAMNVMKLLAERYPTDSRYSYSMDYYY
ncbi:MAG: hypothetical protein HRT35_09020 [Algicola sp.]|nr:hypothetical protein [Algicola sp.]